MERRIVTSRERFTAVLGAQPPARILLEASTESEWVARRLEIYGCRASRLVSAPLTAPSTAAIASPAPANPIRSR